MQSSDKARLLRRVEIFKSISDSELCRIADLCDWRVFRKNETIIREGESDTSTLFLIEGEARTTVTTTKGRRVDFDPMRPGTMFGELGAIDGEPRSANIVANSKCLVASLSRSDFLEVTGLVNTVGLHLAQRMVRRQRDLTSRIMEFNELTVESRVAAELLRLLPKDASESAVTISNCPTQEEIASRTSTDRVSVGKAFVSFASAKIVARGPERATLHILNVPALRRASEPRTD